MKAVSCKFNATSSIDEVLESADMNWVGEVQELITVAGVSVPSNKAIVRSDNSTVIGVVGNRYQPMQNAEAFAFMDVLVQDHKAKYEFLYSIDGGSRVIVQAHIDGGDFEVRKGDQLASYITMINSFDGSTPFKCFFTPIRLFCKNQLRAAIRKAVNSVSIRHTNNIMGKAEEAFAVLGKATQYFTEFKKQASVLANKSLDKRIVDQFIKELLGTTEESGTRKENQAIEIERLVNAGKGNNGSSAWDLYNGAIEWVDHFRGADEEKRAASAFVGSGVNIKEKAWELALKI